MSRFVIGTAGHIDHGKTALVRALTGVDTDRLPEEKARGITIELGFAQLRLPSGDSVGVIDVPGHERYVRTMVAGAVGLDLVVLVVAADEGMMPQTREHLAIAQLLGITRGVIALTKCDVGDAELRELAAAELREQLAGTFLDGAPLIACSAHTGEGIAELTAAIGNELANAPPRATDTLARLPIDRVFTLKGFGTIVTGTLWGGTLRRDEAIIALPSGVQGHVRGLQTHGAAVDLAEAGNRTAVNVTIAATEISRGQVLCHPEELVAGDRLDVRLQYLPTARAPLRRRSRLLVHLGTDQCLATVNLLDCSELAPGASALAQILLDRPFVVMPNDRFIVRGFRADRDHSATVGGGVVLRTLGARHRRATPELSALLRDNERAEPAERVRLEIDRASSGGIALPELCMRVPSSPRRVEALLPSLLTARAIVRFDKSPDRYIGHAALQTLSAALLDALDRHHAAHPLDAGPSLSELRALTHDNPRLLQHALEPLTRAGTLTIANDHVRRSTHDPRRARADTGIDATAERVHALLIAADLNAPRLVEVGPALGVTANTNISAETVRSAIDVLIRDSRAIKIKDLIFAASAVAALREKLLAAFAHTAELTPADWKALTGVSRKFGVPLAEYFDAVKLTLRVGDNRRLRQA